MTCDCLPVGFVSMARACECHFPSCWKLKGFKPVARRMFAACTNIRIRSSGHMLCCWMSINLSHQIEIPKKWTALSDPQRQLSWRCSAGMRNAINTKTNGFTRLRPLKAGGSLLDHIFSMAGFGKLSMWRKSTQPSSSGCLDIPKSVTCFSDTGPWQERQSSRWPVIAFLLVLCQWHGHVNVMFLHAGNWRGLSQLLDGCLQHVQTSAFDQADMCFAVECQSISVTKLRFLRSGRLCPTH